MHVLVVHNFYRSEQPSGEDMVVRQEIEMLRDAGHNVHLYSQHSDDITSFSIAQKIALPAQVVWSPLNKRSISQLMSEEQFDVLHLHNSFPLISPSILSAARQHGVPVVMTLHNYRLSCAAGTFLRNGSICTECLGGTPLPSLIHGCYRNSRKATIPLTIAIATHKALGTWDRGVNTFIVMSSFAKTIMETHGIPADKIMIKPHFIPRPLHNISSRGDYGIYLGRLSPEKGAATLLEAWKPEFGKLKIVGDGPLRSELEKVAIRHGSSVEFLGSMPRPDAMALLAEARYLVNPSRVFETFGLSVVEAFAHGVPAIVPNQGVFPELVSNEYNGLVFNSNDTHSLTSAIATMSDPATAARMGKAAQTDYEQKFTPEQNIEQLQKIYQSAMA